MTGKRFYLSYCREYDYCKYSIDIEVYPWINLNINVWEFNFRIGFRII